MHQQTITNPKVKPFAGVLIVLGLVLAVVADVTLTGFLTALIGASLAALAFWIIGAAITLATMAYFTHSFRYSINNTLLRIAHVYGKRERMMVTIYLNNLVMSGTLEALRERYPRARVESAILRRNPAERYAIAYKDNGKVRILLLQPDETTKNAIIRALRNKK